jgi:Domain of unknown function (DUF4347)/Cadherin-like
MKAPLSGIRHRDLNGCSLKLLQRATKFVHRLALKRISKHRAAGAVRSPSEFIIEPLEERLLMSADPISGGIATVEPVSLPERDPAAISAPLLNELYNTTSVSQGEASSIGSASPASQARSEVVFLDSRIESREDFVRDLLANANAIRQIDVFVLDAERDGIEQVSEALAGYTDLDAVHFISHGSGGVVHLGDTRLDHDSTQIRAQALTAWGAALSVDADLLFYGCDVASSPSGVALVERLSLLTGSDIAASVNRTGFGESGDWILEYRVGEIEAAIAVSPSLQAAWAGILATPTASNLNAAEKYTLNTPLNLADIVVNDADGDALTVTLTLSNTAAGRLSTGASGAVTATYNTLTGVWSASGAVDDVNVLLANVRYTPSLLFLGDFTIATRVDDGVSPPLSGVKNMSAALINLPPTATNLSAPETFTEDTAINLTNIVISDPDSPNVTARLTLSSAAAGSLNTGSSGAVTSTFNPITGMWLASGAIADVNALLAGLTFTPGADYDDNFTISTRVDDGVAPAITGTKSMTAVPVNDAPTASNLNAAETYTENESLNLADIVIVDVDGPSVTAILTLSDTSAGSLNTATSGSVTSTYTAGTGVWSASGALNDVNALLAGLTFTPTSLYSSSFTIATSVDDGVAAAITGTKSMTAIIVNTGPTATNLSAPETYTEDTPLDLTDIVASDADSPNVTVTLTLSDPAAGILATATSGEVTSTFDSLTGVWSASGAIADVNILLAGLTFSPALDYNSDFTIATSVDDGVAPAVIGLKIMTAVAVNDAPVASNLSEPQTYTEDTALDLTDIVVSDVDSTDVTVTLTLSDIAAGSLNTGTSGSVTSTYDAATGIWTASGAIADVNTLLAGLTFTPALNYNSNFTIATSVDDGVAPAVTGLKTMTAVPVNDAPVASNLSKPETYTEDTPLNLTDIVVSDVDSTDVTVTLTLSDIAAGSLNTGTSGAVTSTYDAATGIWTASGAIADVNTLLAGLTFTPALNYNSNFTIATSVDDGLAPAVTGTKNVTGTAVNDAPVLVNNTLTISEGGIVVLSSNEMSATDVDNASASLTFTVSIVSGGQFELVASPGVAITSFTQAQITSGAVRFVHDGGEAAPSYDVRVSDGSLSDGPEAATLSFTNVNDAPTATNLSAAETYTEDTPLNLTDIVVSDVDSPNVTVKLTLSDINAGSLSIGTSGAVTSTYNAGSGVWTASGAVADVNALLASLTFNPALNYNSNFTIATSVDDGVAPAVTGTKNVTGTAVNDAPTATNLSAAETYTEDTPLDLTDIVVSDVDSTDVTVTLTLSDIAAGSLNTGTSGAVTSTYDAATGVWSASGAIADVNTLLAGLTFTPTLNYNSDFTIGTSVDDGVAPAITGVKNFTGTAVNDTPVLANNTLAINEGGSVMLSGTEMSATDVDNASGTLTFSVSNVTGGRFELVASPGAAITTFTQAQVTAGAVRFIHDGGEAAPSYNLTVSDGSLTDGPAAASITFANINDAPVLVNNHLAIRQGSSAVLSGANLSADDVDNPNGSLLFSVSNIVGGRFERTSTPGAAVTSFSQSDVTGGGIRFVHTGGNTAPSYDVTVSDGSLSVGPVPAAVVFEPLDDTGEDLTPTQITPPPPVAPTLPIPEITPPLVLPPNSTGGPVGKTDVDTYPSDASLAVDTLAEVQPYQSSDTTQEASTTSRALPARTTEKGAEIRDGLSLKTDSSVTATDVTVDETERDTVQRGELGSIVDGQSFVQELNRLREELAEELDSERLVVGSSVTVATGFSIGYVLWLLRGEVLLTSLLASLPVWRLIDPLPVLSFVSKRSEDDDDDDSIEAAVQKGAAIAPAQVESARVPQQGTRSIRWRMVAEPAE